jgi:hypothetical protein
LLAEGKRAWMSFRQDILNSSGFFSITSLLQTHKITIIISSHKQTADGGTVYICLQKRKQSLISTHECLSSTRTPQKLKALKTTYDTTLPSCASIYKQKL